jgi:hypothetical protein
MKRKRFTEEQIAKRAGLAKTYTWIEQQYADRKAGKRTVRDTL